MSKSRAVVPYGNDLVLYIEMKRWDEQQKSYIDFDMTNVTDLVVFLTCSKHATDIQLEYTVDEDHNNILVCPVDYRLLHTNASYGCYVEGYDENEKHFRFEMLPSELMLIISNTSGMQPDPNIGVIDIQGRVGFGIGEDTIVLTYGQPIPQGTLDYIFEKNPPVEVKFNDTLYVNLQTKIENNILYFLYIRQLQSQGNFGVTQIMYNINTNIWQYWIDTFSNSADITNKLSTKQDTLVSGTNIKTINNQSILGEGNITIEGGGGTQVQADWDETDTEDPSYIQHKPDLSIYAESANLATVATSGDYDDLNNKPDLSNYATQSDLASKQDTLVSGTNIKTINNESILGSGNITIDNDEANEATANALFELNEKTNYNEQAIEALDASVKSQINQVVKDVNDIINNDVNTQLDEIDDELKAAALEINQLNTDKQDILVSGTNIKTINNQSILGSGNITIEGGGTQVQADWDETDTSDPSYIQNKPIIQQPGFIQLTNGNNIGLISSLSTRYNSNIGNGAVIEGSGISNLSTTHIEASGEQSHAEGIGTHARGAQSHAEGSGSIAYGSTSHAEGITTTANGASSHTEGANTTAQNYAEHAGGRNNLSTKSTETFGDLNNTLFSVGNGGSNTFSQKHNAIEIKQNGDLYIADTNNTTYSNFYEKPMIKLQDELDAKQPTLVSGTNIKTINNQSILGSGNITIEDGGTQVQADWDETDTSDPSYIQHKPDLSIYAESANLATVATSGDYDDLTNKPTLFSGDYDDLTNKPDLSIYAESSDLATVATTGSYNDLSNKPTIPASPVQSNWNETDNTSLAYIQNKPTIPDTTNMMTTDTNQDITGVKTFIGSDKMINFKQSVSTAKMGYKFNNDLSKEVASFEFRPNTITFASDGIQRPLFYFGHYNNNSESTVPSTVIGFRNYLSNNSTYNGAYHLLVPLVKFASQTFSDISGTSSYANYWLPLGFTFDGTNYIKTKQDGKVDFSNSAAVTSSTTGMKIEVVSALPASPDSNTIYIVQ